MLSFIANGEKIIILTPAKSGSTSLRKAICRQSLRMPPWLYHLNYTSLNKMIKDKLVNEPDKIIIPWRSTKERLTSSYRDAFCREGHHFSEWTKEVRLTNSISTFMRSNKLSKGLMPHFSPVFEEEPKKEDFVYEWKQSDKFVKDMTRCD